jgi:hypothetical protein
MRHCREVKIQETAAVIEEIGAQNFILATDLGQTGNPTPPDGLQFLVTELMKVGIGKDWLSARMPTGRMSSAIRCSSNAGAPTQRQRRRKGAPVLPRQYHPPRLRV